MRWTFALGNPAYMEQTDSDSTRMPPIYDKFMEEAFKVADKVEMITPARFLFNAGYTPKAWNEKMLNDEHFKVLSYEPESSKIFNNTEIKGGVAISYRDQNKNYGAIKIFTKYQELNGIIKKIQNVTDESLENIISSPLSFQLSDLMKKDHPELLDRLRTSAFTTLKEIFYSEKPNDNEEYIKMIGVLGNKRTYRFVRKDYIKDNSGTLNTYTLLVSKANGSGLFGETLAPAIIAAPGVGYTQSFIAIGRFKSEEEASNVNKYIKTKLARALLGVLKITQDCPGPKWKYVPLQDFTSNSDIDWSKSVKEIDEQLYRKYNLDESEIEFIESHVKEMI